MKLKKLFMICILMSTILVTNSINTHKSIAISKDEFNVDEFIEQLDLSTSYINVTNKKIKFLNDVLAAANNKHDFKNFKEFIEYANNNESFVEVIPYSIIENNKYVYHDNIINRADKLTIIIKDNQLYVVHPQDNIEEGYVCLSTVSDCYTLTEQKQYYKNLINDDTYIYEVDIAKYHLPLDIIQYNCPFGYRNDPFTGEKKYHSGVDLQASMNTDIYAVEAGTVKFAGDNNDGYGYCVIIEHEDNYSTLYAHCNTLLVNTGEIVSAGQVIAKSGNSGRSTGPHLHFEYLENGKAINPSKYLEGGN